MVFAVTDDADDAAGDILLSTAANSDRSQDATGSGGEKERRSEPLRWRCALPVRGEMKSLVADTLGIERMR
jgi:hypothetical protein